MIGALLVFGWNGSLWWTSLVLAAGLGALALLLLGVDESVRPVIAAAVVPLAAGGLSAPLMSQRGQPAGLGLTIAAGVVAIAAIVWATGSILAAPSPARSSGGC
ncbi:hypothetical protein P9139_16125 [Curtobacterium flaccumfaciens]|nr:hypothetical protein P9139_16125 [Curtobacterium flaccumfaciens]